MSQYSREDAHCTRRRHLPLWRCITGGWLSGGLGLGPPPPARRASTVTGSGKKESESHATVTAPGAEWRHDCVEGRG
jgi:hypothetical protein